MELAISYTHAMNHHPKEAAEAIARLRKSRSKHRKADPSTLSWKYSWCLEVRGHSFKQLMDGTAQRDAARREAMSLKQRIQDEASRTKVHIVVASNGYYAPLQTVPPEIMKGIIESQTEEERERAEVNAMTEEERAAHVQDLLSQLRGPGFVAL